MQEGIVFRDIAHHYFADIWKRTFTQVLTKGIVMERWGHKVYWVIQEPVYEDFLDRYKLHGMRYDRDHNTVFAIYDMRRRGLRYELYQKRVESATVDALFEAFRTNLMVPPKDDFVSRLEARVKGNAEGKLGLEL